MKVLYVTGACLTKNTSANMSHNGYVQGFLENGCEVDIIMANDSWGKQDAALKKWEQASYYEYNSVSFRDRLRNRGREAIKQPQTNTNAASSSDSQKRNLKGMIRQTLKKLFYTLFPNDPVYPLQAQWLKSAAKFKSEKKYDLIVSNSSPAASHKLVMELLQKKAVRTEKWVQIWEDPWYYDLYGGHTEAERQEENNLLKAADVICYVSPLTLMYQKKYFSDYSDKMFFIPLPAFRFSENTGIYHDRPVFGYFGDYFSHVRNLCPFINVMKSMNLTAYVIGDTDIGLESTDQILIKPRMTLAELADYQRQTDVLVHLCNLKGGQIPGKIYHYSVTDRPILFIIDGTDEEKDQIYHFFKPYERYHFCENNESDISRAATDIVNQPYLREREVEDFYPKNIVKNLIEKII